MEVRSSVSHTLLRAIMTNLTKDLTTVFEKLNIWVSDYLGFVCLFLYFLAPPLPMYIFPQFSVALCLAK